LLYSSRTCGYTRPQTSGRCVCQPIQLSKNFFSPRPAECSRAQARSLCYSDNKKPGVERRVPSPHNGEETRCSTAFYPVFVINLTPYLLLRGTDGWTANPSEEELPTANPRV